MVLKVFVAALAAACAICGVNAQTTSLDDCHLHDGVEYCHSTDATPTASVAPSTVTYQTTAVTDCHIHGATPVCVNGAGEEVQLILAATQTASDALPTAYTNCHAHDDDLHCEGPNGEDAEFKAMKHSHDEEHGDDHDHADDDHSHDEEESECHTHDGVEHCHESEDDDHTHSGSEEIEDHTHADGEGEDCHTHDGVEHCHDGEAGHTHSAAESANAETTPRECHFHAGVEHCTGGTAQQQAATCERVDRDYNINLRIGLIFAMLAACAVAVYLPLFLKSFLNMDTSGLTFTIIKQFGTGVIVATAFVHLLTHANLMFSNDCLPPLKYEATTSAIAMAGAFIAFLIEYLGHRLATWRRGSIVAAQAHIDSEASDDNSAVNAKEAHSHSHSHEHSHTGVHHTHTHATDHATGIEGLSNRNNVIADAETCSIAPQDKFSVFVLEAGIIFHSILLGITLVVAGDSVFITLFIVILFHQMFEGLALGARIAALASPHVGHGLFSWTRVKNLVMPGIFAIITPIGMAIGIGVLQSFNGNDPSTIIALGTLDALSAGILLWVGLVGMWAHDWMFGELRDAGWKRTVPAMTALIAGLALMGILGKWA